MPAEERSPGSRAMRKGEKDMTTGERLPGSEKVRRLQTVLHAKAKEEPDRRFHALIDKVWREDFLAEAWRRVRRNGGSSGVDGETFADIELYGVARWLGELARELKDGTYTPKPVLQVLIPKKQPGKLRPLGIPCIRDRVAQTSALLVLEPIFEADLQPEQYAYRPERSAHDAVQRVHSLLNRRHNEVVDCDLSNYFGEIPHAELLKSFARRISDGRMLKLIKAWLEMPVEEDDGEGGKRRTNRARKERKGIPQGAPISPLASNLYMRRFILGWKTLGFARRFRSEIVNYADDLCVLGKGPGGGHAGGGRAAHGGSEAPGQRAENPMPAVPGGSVRVSGLPHRTQLPTAREGVVHRNPSQHGQRPKHPPQNQRVDDPTTGLAEAGGNRGTPEPGNLRMGELLQPRASRPSLQGSQLACERAAAPVALVETQDQGREIRALPGRPAVSRIRPHSTTIHNRSLSSAKA